MSQHPSLRSSEKMKQHRSVLKRFERLRILKEKGDWEDGKSVFGLQKVKMVRFKIKKEKTETAEAGAEAAPGAAAVLPSASAASAKAPGAAKAAPAKTPGAAAPKDQRQTDKRAKA